MVLWLKPWESRSLPGLPRTMEFPLYVSRSKQDAVSFRRRRFCFELAVAWDLGIVTEGYASGEGRLAECGVLLRTVPMDSDRRSAQVERLEVVETGRRRRWSEDEKLKIVLESLQAPRQVAATARRYVFQSVTDDIRRLLPSSEEAADAGCYFGSANSLASGCNALVISSRRFCHSAPGMKASTGASPGELFT